MFEIIFLILVSGYFIISATLIVGAKKTFLQLTEDKLPTVSVIVAARNEERNILSCLEALDQLIYSEGKFEVIIVDDASTDNTLKLASNFIDDKKKFR
ncbi:MAG: glycosyltransferase, partial [Ignavibacteriaceae bacterium]|nr:glycosyltransferase [Ignavibacteriaceae bacterium]